MEVVGGIRVKRVPLPGGKAAFPPHDKRRPTALAREATAPRLALTDPPTVPLLSSETVTDAPPIASRTSATVASSTAKNFWTWRPLASSRRLYQ